jgi:hypothetical protein
MLVPHNFDMGELTFELVKPYIPNQQGELVESTKWMVRIHPGMVSWFTGGPLLDMKTRKTALFDTAEEGLKAAIDFAHYCGLREP